MIAFADSTDYTVSGLTTASSDGHLTIYHSNAATSLPACRPVDVEKEWKAKMRAQCRELTLAAQAKLSKLHDRERGPSGHQWRTWHRRPGRRHTSTAVRNFRRR